MPLEVAIRVADIEKIIQRDFKFYAPIAGIKERCHITEIYCIARNMDSTDNSSLYQKGRCRAH